MAATYGAAVSAAAPAILDTAGSQDTGAACEGIGLIGNDAVSIGGSRIGGAPGAELVFETNV